MKRGRLVSQVPISEYIDGYKPTPYRRRMPSLSRAIPRGSIVIPDPFSNTMLGIFILPRYAESMAPVGAATTNNYVSSFVLHVGSLQLIQGMWQLHTLQEALIYLLKLQIDSTRQDFHRPILMMLSTGMRRSRIPLAGPASALFNKSHRPHVVHT